METIDDIVADIREQSLGMPDDMECVSPLVCDMLRLADRIEKAYKSMVEGLNGGIVERDQYIEKLTNENARLRAELNKDDCLKLANDVDHLRAENERLRSALQPVLDCDVTKESYLAQSEAVWISQRIWKEGEAK